MTLEQHLVAVQPWLDEWGYAAVFACIFVEGVGIPAPGQMLLVAGGLLASRGELSLAPLLATAVAAAALGNALGWEIGRRGGRPLLQRFARGERLSRVERLFRRSGKTLVVLGRFVDGARQLSGLAAGAFGMAPRPFFASNLVGALLWSGFWGVGAYVFGRDFDAIALAFHQASPALLIAAPLAVALLLVWLLIRRARG